MPVASLRLSRAEDSANIATVYFSKYGMDFLLGQFLADTSRKSGDTIPTGHFSENDPDPFPELLLTNYGNRGKFNILEINYTK